MGNRSMRALNFADLVHVASPSPPPPPPAQLALTMIVSERHQRQAPSRGRHLFTTPIMVMATFPALRSKKGISPGPPARERYFPAPSK
jgi:hypothetical protein